MAQGGETITYTYSDGTSVSEDVSDIDQIVIDYCDGAGGEGLATKGGSGGRVENVTVDVSNESTIYIWVAGGKGEGYGRYRGGPAGVYSSPGAGSTEVSLVNTESADSSDEPFLAGAGGGGGGEGDYGYQGNGGARGGTGNEDAEGVAPPAGGDGRSGQPGEDGDGAIDDQNRAIVSGGTTIKGGGSAADTNGEIQISYKVPNSPPSFTTDSESPTDTATGVSLDPTLSVEVTDPDGDSMSVTFRDDSDGSKIGSTQTGVADGGTASVTWSGLESDTTYSWYAVVDDGSATTTSATFSFTTFALTFEGTTIGGLTIDGNTVTGITTDGSGV